MMGNIQVDAEGNGAEKAGNNTAAGQLQYWQVVKQDIVPGPPVRWVCLLLFEENEAGYRVVYRGERPSARKKRRVARSHLGYHIPSTGMIYQDVGLSVAPS